MTGGVRMESLPTVVAAIAPHLPDRRLSVLIRYAAWSVRLDDHLDRSDATPAALRRVRDLVAAATLGHPGGPRDPLRDELAAILAELSAYDRRRTVVTALGAALRDAVRTGAAHASLARAVAAGRARAPTAERYLTVAARTVNYRSFAYALLALGGTALTAPALAQLDPALWRAAYAVRLANDLRSVARDRAAGALNVLGLRTRAGQPVTRRLVRATIDHQVRAHDAALAHLSSPDSHGAGLAAPARALARGLHRSVALYLVSDLR